MNQSNQIEANVFFSLSNVDKIPNERNKYNVYYSNSNRSNNSK